MAIMVGENYKLTADKYNIILLEKHEVRARKSTVVDTEEIIDESDKAEKGWKVGGYYSCVANALDALVRKEISKTELKDLQTVVDVVNKLFQEIRQALVEIPVGSLHKSLVGGDTSERTE